MVKLFNKGRSEIVTAEGVFKPETVKEFSDKQAQKLKRLFPTELMDLEDATAKFFKEDAPAMAQPAKVEQETRAPAETDAEREARELAELEAELEAMGGESQPE